MQPNCSVRPCSSSISSSSRAFHCPAMWRKAPVLSGLMLPLCRSFLSNSSEAESLSTERIPNQISLYSRLPELLAQNHTALQHAGVSANILLSPLHPPSLFPLPLSTHFHARPSTHPQIPHPNPSACSVFSLKKKKKKKEKWNCGRIPPVQVSVMCCDERTRRQRGLLIMEHTGPLAAAAPAGDAEVGGEERK